MKKFFTFLLILIILGGIGTGFYFGWIQMRLGENDYGVVFTKVKGYDQEVLEPGKFIWRWEALLPTNFTLHIFHLEPRSSRVSLKGVLPSGELYGQFFDGTPDFSYDITLSLNYMLKPEALPGLVKEAYVTPEELDTWYRGKEDAALVEAANLLRKRMEEPGFYGTAGLPAEGFEKDLTERLNEAFPELLFSQALVVNLVLPDAELYRRAREAYFSLMETRELLSARALEEATSQTMSQSVNLELLEKYGELFTTYPILLDYLNLNPQFAEEMLLPGNEP